MSTANTLRVSPHLRYNRVRTEGDHTAMEELAQSKDDSGPDSEIELFEKK